MPKTVNRNIFTIPFRRPETHKQTLCRKFINMLFSLAHALSKHKFKLISFRTLVTLRTRAPVGFAFIVLRVSDTSPISYPNQISKTYSLITQKLITLA